MRGQQALQSRRAGSKASGAQGTRMKEQATSRPSRMTWTTRIRGNSEARKPAAAQVSGVFSTHAPGRGASGSSSALT